MQIGPSVPLHDDDEQLLDTHLCMTSSLEEKSSRVWSRSSTSSRLPGRGGLIRCTSVLAVNLSDDYDSSSSSMDAWVNG